MKNLLTVLAFMIGTMAFGQVEGMERYTGRFSGVGEMELCHYGENVPTYIISGTEITAANIEEVLSECKFILESNGLDYDDPIADMSEFLFDDNNTRDILEEIMLGGVIDKSWGMMINEEDYVVFWVFMSDFKVEFGFEFRNDS